MFVLCSLYFVPEERIELSPLARHDFESCASTNSATPAYTWIVYQNFVKMLEYESYA